jgi:hypothetical protein
MAAQESRRDYGAMFWAKVNKNSGVFAVVNGSLSECWIWIGCKNENGYGQLTVKRKHQKAHRWIYEQINGPIAKGLELDHLCRNTSCIRPDHLEPVTRSENIKRGSLKNVLRARAEQITHCPRGHEYTKENTFRRSRGSRECRTCMRARNILSRQRRLRNGPSGSLSEECLD